MKVKDRDRLTDYLCGFCIGAALASDGTRASHNRCPGSMGGIDCACAQRQHRLSPKLAEHMSTYCHLPVEAIYGRHDRKRRTLTDEQREAAIARLAVAREARTAKRRERDRDLDTACETAR